MASIISRFSDIVKAKELREKRAFSVRIITEESGASRSTVEGLLKNTMKRVPLEDLAALCTYFNCGVEDILYLEEFSFAALEDEPKEIANPSLIYHAPFVGFQLFERGDAYIWVHHASLVRMEDSAAGGCIITYWTSNDRLTSRSFNASCPVADGTIAVAKVKQVTEQANLDSRRLRTPQADAGVTEAVAWFTTYQDTDFATNRFQGSRNARTFTDQLYKAGAAFVGVVNQSMGVTGPYSDTLFVQVPVRWGDSVALLARLAAEAEGYGVVMEGARQAYSFILRWD